LNPCSHVRDSISLAFYPLKRVDTNKAKNFPYTLRLKTAPAGGAPAET
jgi:hypothetical protein